MTRAKLPAVTNDVPALPSRPPAMHKGQAGRVAIVAGSRGMSGAALLSALGALRGGAGLVRVYCPGSILPIVAAGEPCLMTVPLPEDEAGHVALTPTTALDLNWADVVAIGPGLGQAGGVAQGGTGVSPVSRVLAEFAGPIVVDADGLNTLAPRGPSVWSARTGRPTLITPHPGEMERLRAGAGLGSLSGDDDATRLQSAHEYAAQTGLTVVLKGHRTVVCTPAEAYVNTTGNAGMATGGMGDVLTGLAAALLAQGLASFDAARLAVYVHGLAADHCARDIGPVGYLARDVADAIPRALAEASRPRIGFR